MATYGNLYLTYCNENVIYVRLFWELRGFSPNFTLCDCFIYSQDWSTYFLHQNRQINLHCPISLVASESESRNNFSANPIVELFFTGNQWYLNER